MIVTSETLITCGFLAVLTVLLWRFVRNDRAEYEAFKTLDDSSERRRFYRKWILSSFLTFGVATLVILALLGRLPALIAMPAEFAPLAERLQALRDETSGARSSGFWIGFVGSICVIAVLSAFMTGIGRRKAKQVVLGDVQPLLPRNAAERSWTALLSVNAGLSEELFFRLLLPLLLATVTGDALVAFTLSAVIFGLIHLYQGWSGVLATIVVGLVLTAVYLASGDLWKAILVHALIDLRGLFLTPLLRELAASRGKRRAA